MLKNNNQAVIKTISNRSLKQNRMRNICVILAIILTTLMFTNVFTIGFSLAKNLNTTMIRNQGTIASITLKQPTKKQIEQAKKAESLNVAGIRISTGVATDKSGKEKIVLDYYDTPEFQGNFSPAISDTHGSYPEKQDEIMLSKYALDALKIENPKKGMQITLSINAKEQVFRLSGWFQNYTYTSGGYLGLISSAYVEKLGFTIEENGILCLSSKAGKQASLLTELNNLVVLNKGQEFHSTYDVQQENQDTVVVTATVIGIMGFIILTSGYLLIYNVMYISITKDIRFYGMLKTIGTAPSQIKKIVKMQSTSLSLIGIPIGVAIGVLVSFGAVPYALKTFEVGKESIMPSDISFNPFIYIGTIGFAIVTVAISCRKPAKFASKISPVEALKYNGQNKINRKQKKGTDGGKIYKMAFRNVFREKKRAILVFASLFMGSMAFLSVNTFIGSMKLENYVDFYLPNDYTIYTYSGSQDNTEDEEKEYMKKAEQLAKDIKNIDGVKNVSINYSGDTMFQFDEQLFLPFLENAFSERKEMQEAIEFYKNTKEEDRAYSSPVIAISSEMIKEYNKRASQKINIEQFDKGEVCLLGFVNTKKQAKELFGKKITLIDKASKKTKTFTITSCPTREESYRINVGYYWMKGGAPDLVLISEAALKDFCSSYSINNIIVDCEKEAESAVTFKMKQLTKSNPCVMQLEIKSERMSSFVSSMNSMNILGDGISVVLILIGIINFINVMLTGVFTRRGELAVLESIGMTKKQIQKMLVYEGVYYGCSTILLILTIGNGIIFVVADLAQKVADYAVFHYPIGLMSGIAVIIMGICMIVPSLVYKNLSKESVTERLRGGE